VGREGTWMDSMGRNSRKGVWESGEGERRVVKWVRM
jgi:hypothetical protein